MTPESFAETARRTGSVVLDIRPFDAFGGQHVPGAWHIDYRGNFATFAGWTLPANGEIFLVADSDLIVREAAIWLKRVGLDHVKGYLDGGMLAWNAAGLPTEDIMQISPLELHQMVRSNSSMILVDARSAREFEALHIPGSINIPAPDMRKRHAELSKNTPITVICGSGVRSSLAGSILRSNGFKDVKNVAGGINGYVAAGLLQ
jgi:rhodanese-related sulfurtransferase